MSGPFADEQAKAMRPLEVGDVVRLKSGSPPLTVASFGTRDGATMVRVVWLDEKAQAQGGTFDARCLR